jgi:mannonate dehydratase
MPSQNETGFEYTWRWFGPNDPVSLKEIKQTGATGIVTALHQIPVGEVWPFEEILKRKRMIEAEGFRWSVVESVPVHEDIKRRSDNYKEYTENYKCSLRNLSQCGINRVCYNFMPVLDWSRTELNVQFRDGTFTSKFELKSMAAFDMFILKRPGAENDYNDNIKDKAQKYFSSLNEYGKQKLISTILFGLPGSNEAYTLDEFRTALANYKDISEADLLKNLQEFIKEITPVAEESEILLGVHPDDPPMSLLGLPRVVGSKENLQKILDASDLLNNGLTFCTGSLGAGYKNDLVDIAKSFSERINFIHLRNVNRTADGDFIEVAHLDGDVDMYGVMKVFVEEQISRAHKGRKDTHIPMRPDHGLLILDDRAKKNIYPGYSIYGRMKGLAELRGLETGIRLSLEN